LVYEFIHKIGDKSMETSSRDLLIQVNRYKQLFHAAEKFHSYLDNESILREIIVTLEELYPEFTYFLLLSEDNNDSSMLPIIDLEYDSENIAAMQAFLSGDIQLEESCVEKNSILYAPLKGKQGVYGVLKVIAPTKVEFPKNEVEFICLLAGAAGSSLENTKLYQQSRKIISDLKLINETSHKLNSNLRLAETMKYMSKQIKQTSNAQEVGFFLFSQEQSNVKILPGTTPYFLTKQARIYIDYIKSKIQIEKDPLFIGDLSLPKINNVVNFHSVIAVPLVQTKKMIGFSLVMHEEAYFFPFETFKLLQSLIYHSSLALSNSMLREELEQIIITDHLTKLHSRNYLDEKIQFAMKEDEEGTFILLDIDNFKEINDTYGHQVGDDVLVQVANIIKINIRGNDVGARWGGEELAVYLPKVPLEAGVTIAERLVEKVAECSYPRITVSCGVSYWHKDRLDSYNYLFKRADEALYLAKGTGKNKVVPQKNNTRAS
jgi:diguanylate cyclase (GGDEF)-like protein